MSHPLLAAFGLILVFEGILPFLNPERWRVMVKNIAGMKDQQLRIFGLLSMLVGSIIIFVLHHFYE